MNNADTATVRTGVNATALGVISYIVTNIFGWTIDVSDPGFIAAVAIGVPIFYRLTTVLTEKWPPLGYIFFGVRNPPVYTPPE